ncbi:thaumatin-like protein 1b [Ricinus communis]|uniref:Protein P21, putative n=1 Tax=Ricinus communis TaxID=3988 RepID=B9S0C6_RICCO|nr:thaumatin-like protein 1b [Ricinus communis]EEF42859.1 Protein P21, putative [Ricinus communis]|eukprot:XP_002519445.1 thaumatin-like protein 1b [Ricinus communis]
MASKLLFNLLAILMLITGGSSDLTFFIENNCLNTLWLASSPSNGDLNPENGPGTLEVLSMPDPWSGSIWARTKCTTNETGYFSCETGDCGSGARDCHGAPPTNPITLLNFNINSNAVSYEVSLIHGHNLAVRIEPDGGNLVGGGSGPCPVVDCVQDISNICPSTLVALNRNGAYAGCNNPCDVLKDPKFCGPNEYSSRFKELCNLAHTYPGDNNPPLYKCNGANSYNITLCPL